MSTAYDQETVQSASEELSRLVESMVENPREVRIDSYQDGETTVFELDVSEEDLGKVIGRQGRTARALRALLEVRGRHDGCRYELEICEE